MYQENLAKLIPLLQKRDIKITCAESCTGGMLASILTEKAGSSRWFEMGFVTYSNEAKQLLLEVSKTTLDQFGAVSIQTAKEMALGAQKKANADFALSITGIAGPDGGSNEKPVGTVCFGFTTKTDITTYRMHFNGDREQVRLHSVNYCLSLLLNTLLTEEKA